MDILWWWSTEKVWIEIWVYSIKNKRRNNTLLNVGQKIII